MAAIDNTKKSARLLASRRYTHDTYTDAQEAFTSTLDINANEVYVDQSLIPSSGLPFSGSGQNGSTYSVNGQDVIKYWYRQPLTKSDLNNEVWFFLNPEGAAGGIGAQIIDATQLTNFVSPKYSVPALANANTEDATPGYGVKVFVSSNSTSPSAGDQVSVNNYTFDYKTGVIQFTTSAVAPTAGQYVYVTVNQYVGRVLTDNITNVSSSIAAISASIGGAGGGSLSDRITSLEATSASLLLSSSNHEGRIDDIEAYTSSLKTAMTASGTDVTFSNNVTVQGNLVVAGTTTAVNSTTIQLGDNIIELNGTGTTNGGLVVKDPTAPNTVSGSLLWDSTNDYWKAGALGSEERLLRAGSDSVVSGSIQIDITGTTGYSTFSGSISSSISASAENLRIVSASVNDRLNQLSADSASQDGRLDNLELFSSSINVKFSDLSTYTSSLNSYTESFSASVSTSFSASAASLNSFSSSTSASQFIFSSSVSTSFSASNASITALSASVASVTGDFSSSVATSFSASDARVTLLSSSVDTRLNQLSADSASQDNRLDQLETFSGSQEGKDVIISAYTASMNTFTASVNGHISDINTKTGSFEGNFVTLSTYTASMNTFTSSQEAKDVIISAYTSSMNSFTASINSFTQSFSSSVSTSFSASAANVLALSTSVDSRLDTLEGTGTIQGVGTTNEVTFQKVTTTGDVVVGGDLVVQGNTVTLNTATLVVEDKLISLASGSTNAATANGAGIEILGANATFTYDSTPNAWTANIPISASAFTGSFNLPTGGSSKRIAFRGTTGNLDVVTAPTTNGDLLQWNGSDFVMSNVIDGGTY